FFSSRRRHTRSDRDWSSDVCSSDLSGIATAGVADAMKLFLDTAIYEEIQQGVTWGVIDGVTTNPTLIAKAGHDHEDQVKRICQRSEERRVGKECRSGGEPAG